MQHTAKRTANTTKDFRAKTDQVNHQTLTQ